MSSFISSARRSPQQHSDSMFNNMQINLNPCHGLGALLVWFLLFSYAARLVLITMKPAYIMVGLTTEICPKKLFMYSMIFSLVVIAVLFAVQRFF